MISLAFLRGDFEMMVEFAREWYADELVAEGSAAGAWLGPRDLTEWISCLGTSKKLVFLTDDVPDDKTEQSQAIISLRVDLEVILDTKVIGIIGSQCRKNNGKNIQQRVFASGHPPNY
jgi:hypothetical protein